MKPVNISHSVCQNNVNTVTYRKTKIHNPTQFRLGGVCFSRYKFHGVCNICLMPVAADFATKSWTCQEKCSHKIPKILDRHTFRHLFVSLEIEAGIDPTTIAAMVGHGTPQTTLTTYSHFFADTKRRASNIIADIIEGKTAG